ncbi:MAG: NUDIX hydrolase [SAR86 cluster bacterium]|uniref:NUDIX hydrolase n=1 Tax=SAR86 cluster bacterium TaxID=2030880 RepID=A0A2A4ML37_9GAMM|nr:MAG: NUDIX hydrolase [SAR86 cluster bacterium]
MKFCSNCAGAITLRIPTGDDKPRHCCDHCQSIFYQNPKNIVGTLPIYQDKVLLCKRAIEPRLGKWTLPAGFMENGESALEGAIRETHEEAGANITIGAHSLYTLFNLPKINQLYIFFRAELSNVEFNPGEESLEVALFSEADIPWKELAFPVISSTLKYYFQDRKNKHFPVRMCDVHYDKEGNRSISLLSESSLASQS